MYDTNEHEIGPQYLLSGRPAMGTLLDRRNYRPPPLKQSLDSSAQRQHLKLK